MKIYLYSDSEYQIDAENVFLSGAYKNIKDFKKQNPGMVPIKEYDAVEYLTILKTILKKEKKK